LAGRRPRRILITGGAKAGKSRFAQDLAERGAYRRRLFVATAVACDSEMQERIARHRRSRCAGGRGGVSANGNHCGLWTTLEEPTHLPERLPKAFLSSKSVILLDCLPTFVTNLFLQGVSQVQIQERVRKIVQACNRPGLTTLFVSNEVGLGVVPDHPLGREFRDLLGVVNQQVAQVAEEVYLVVAGVPLRVK